MRRLVWVQLIPVTLCNTHLTIWRSCKWKNLLYFRFHDSRLRTTMKLRTKGRYKQVCMFCMKHFSCSRWKLLNAESTNFLGYVSECSHTDGNNWTSNSLRSERLHEVLFPELWRYSHSWFIWCSVTDTARAMGRNRIHRLLQNSLLHVQSYKTLIVTKKNTRIAISVVHWPPLSTKHNLQRSLLSIEDYSGHCCQQNTAYSGHCCQQNRFQWSLLPTEQITVLIVVNRTYYGGHCCQQNTLEWSLLST
jgi:hypothetical protein